MEVIIQPPGALLKERKKAPVSQVSPHGQTLLPSMSSTNFTN